MQKKIAATGKTPLKRIETHTRRIIRVPSRSWKSRTKQGVEIAGWRDKTVDPLHSPASGTKQSPPLAGVWDKPVPRTNICDIDSRPASDAIISCVRWAIRKDRFYPQKSFSLPKTFADRSAPGPEAGESCAERSEILLVDC